MKKIKSLLCLFVALALGLVCVLPAYAEETAEVSYAVDAVRIVTWTDVLGEGRRDLAAAVVERIWSLLPERLRERLDLKELLGTMDLSSLLLSVDHIRREERHAAMDRRTPERHSAPIWADSTQRPSETPSGT